MPALNKYLESGRVKKDDLVSILFGMHKRKMKEMQTDTQEGEAYAVEREKLTDNACSVIKLERLKAAGYTGYSIRKTAYRQAGKKEDKIPPAIKKDISFEYSVRKIIKDLGIISSIRSGISRYQYFLDNILRDYLLALSDGAADIKGYKEGNKESLTYRVMEAASAIDNNLFERLKDIVNLHLGVSVSYSQLKERLLELRKEVLAKEEVDRFIFSFLIIKNGRLFILVEAEEIKERVFIEKRQIEGLGIDAGRFEDKIPLIAHVVEKHPFMEEKHTRGIFKGEK